LSQIFYSYLKCKNKIFPAQSHPKLSEIHPSFTFPPQPTSFILPLLAPTIQSPSLWKILFSDRPNILKTVRLLIGLSQLTLKLLLDYFSPRISLPRTFHYFCGGIHFILPTTKILPTGRPLSWYTKLILHPNFLSRFLKTVLIISLLLRIYQPWWIPHYPLQHLPSPTLTGFNLISLGCFTSSNHFNSSTLSSLTSFNPSRFPQFISSASSIGASSNSFRLLPFAIPPHHSFLGLHSILRKPLLVHLTQILPSASSKGISLELHTHLPIFPTISYLPQPKLLNYLFPQVKTAKKDLIRQKLHYIKNKIQLSPLLPNSSHRCLSLRSIKIPSSRQSRYHRTLIPGLSQNMKEYISNPLEFTSLPFRTSVKSHRISMRSFQSTLVAFSGLPNKAYTISNFFELNPSTSKMFTYSPFISSWVFTPALNFIPDSQQSCLETFHHSWLLVGSSNICGIPSVLLLFRFWNPDSLDPSVPFLYQSLNLKPKILQGSMWLPDPAWIPLISKFLTSISHPQTQRLVLDASCILPRKSSTILMQRNNFPSHSFPTLVNPAISSKWSKLFSLSNNRPVSAPCQEPRTGFPRSTHFGLCFTPILAVHALISHLKASAPGSGAVVEK